MSDTPSAPAPQPFFPPALQAEIVQHMNGDHADTLLLYARHLAGQGESQAARLVSLDANALTLSVSGPRGEELCTVPFRPPLVRPEEARAALVAMAREARSIETLSRARTTARWFRTEFKTVLLGTTSTSGEPDASVAPAVLGADGAFYIFISELARHTANLLSTGRASVLLVEDEAASSQLLARRRLTFTCTATEIPRDHPEAAPHLAALHTKFGPVFSTLAAMTDFHLVRLLPTRGRLVNGFGQAFAVNPLSWDDLSALGGGGHGGPVAGAQP